MFQLWITPKENSETEFANVIAEWELLNTTDVFDVQVTSDDEVMLLIDAELLEEFTLDISEHGYITEQLRLW